VAAQYTSVFFMQQLCATKYALLQLGHCWHASYAAQYALVPVQLSNLANVEVNFGPRVTPDHVVQQQHRHLQHNATTVSHHQSAIILE
jgi:hypothetical protein